MSPFGYLVLSRCDWSAGFFSHHVGQLIIRPSMVEECADECFLTVSEAMSYISSLGIWVLQ